MSNSNLVGIFDSGLGGLSVWREVVRQLPHERILYLADQAHVPYGSRKLTEVRALSEGITRFLLNQGVKIIVVACNTASAAALHHLRRTFPEISFVGMEPALKPAIEQTRTGVVGVIATQATFQGELFASLMERYAGNVQVLTQACPELVQVIESGALDTPKTRALLQSYLSPMMKEGADQLVLGCTHYPFLRSIIEQITGPDVGVIDPASAVACQTERVLTQRELENDQNTPSEHVFYTSGDTTAFALMIERLLPFIESDVIVHPARWRNGQLGTRRKVSDA